MGLPGAAPPPEWVRASWEAEPGPRGEKEQRGRGSRSTGRDVWAGLGQLWYCGTAVGPGEGWRSEQTEGVTFSFPKPWSFGKPSRAQSLWAACRIFPPGCQNSRMAADNSGCQTLRTTDQGLPRPSPTGAQALARSPAGPAVPLVSSIPSRAKILGCSGWAPPSILSSFPGPGAGLGCSLQPLLPSHPLGPAGRALLDRQTGGMLPCCGLSTLLGKAVCQGLQVPAWILAPSQGASWKQMQA